MNLDCEHTYGEDGVCTCCKESYSAAHDKNPNDIHPAMQRLVESSQHANYDREGHNAYREHRWDI